MPPLPLLAGCSDSDAVLSAHNSYRAQHGAPALTWSASLTAKAQVWADHLTTQNGCWLSHSTWATGENLYMSSGMPAQINSQCLPATKAWYNEISAYHFTSNPWSSNSGNFESIGCVLRAMHESWCVSGLLHWVVQGVLVVVPCATVCVMPCTVPMVLPTDQYDTH